MAKTVSIPVSVDLKANAASMKELYRDISDLIANIDPSSALAKNINKVMGRLKDQVTDFELISNKSFIQQSDVNSALSIFKRFYRDIGRMNEDIQGAGFNSFIHEDSVIKALQTIQDELDKVQDAAEKIKTVNIGDAFKIENKDQKSIKDLQKKFSLDADDSASLVEARSAAIANLTSKTEEYNQALERQKELQESQKKIQDKITQRSNAYNTNFGTSEQRRKFAFGQMYESIASMKGNWSIDTYEKSFNDIVATFFETTKSGKVKFTNFGQDRLNNLASLLGIDLSTVKQDAATLQQEILKAISNLNFADVRRAIGSGKKEFAAMGDGYQIAKQAWVDYNGFEAKDRIELDNQLKASNTELNNLSAQIPLLKGLMDEADSLQNQIDELYNAVFGDLDKEAKERRRELSQQIKQQKEKADSATKGSFQGVTDRVSEQASNLGQENELNLAAQQAQKEAENFKQNLKLSIKHWMGAQQVITYVRQGVRQAYQDIKALDKSMTDIAVVTDFSVSDLWGKINEYMSIAQQYGVTTQGVYEVSQLYFQQGLGEADTMQLTTETLKMARIAGMEYKDAADGMTVALRGFKMEMEDAARVTDVYSKVAAVTASDSQELIEAMSKTASSAASVGSGFEETTAMLAVMIEATREAPTNIGSAMKSIISRYGEMTKGMSVDAEGEEIVFNKVDAALQSVGVSMKDATGQFREFDEVIYELASKWESLDSLSQRYVATVFAGNRQQSRFLALMSNYDRLVEVTESAENSEDAGLLQYSKTLDSLETKLNSIKTSFQQFYMNILNGDTFKGFLDIINNLLNGLNKLPKLDSILGIGAAIVSIKKFSNTLIDGVFGLFNKATKGGSIKDTLFGGKTLGGSAFKKFFNKKDYKKSVSEENREQRPIPVKTENKEPAEAKITNIKDLALEIETQKQTTTEKEKAKSKADEDYNTAKKRQADIETQNRIDKYWRDDLEQQAKQKQKQVEDSQKVLNKKNITENSRKYHQAQVDQGQKDLERINKELAEQRDKVVKSDKELLEANTDLKNETEKQKHAAKEYREQYYKQKKLEEEMADAERKQRVNEKAGRIADVGADILSIAGAGLTAASLAVADENIVAGKKMAAAGTVASVGGQITALAAQIHPLAGAITAVTTAVVAAGAAIFTTASDVEIAQQKFDQAKITSEEADIERAEKQNRAAVLDSSLKSLKNLEESQWDSAEAQEAFIEAQNSLAASYPELITAYDSAGNAIVDISNAEAQLAAIRKEGAAAALAATEAEIVEKNAELNLNWTKQREAGEATETTNTDNTAENFLLFNPGRVGIRDSLTGDIKERYENFIKTYGEMTFDEMTFALENEYKDLKEIFFPEGYESYEEAIANVVSAEDYETYILERTQRMQEAQALNQAIIGLEKARIGNVATIALEDFAIAQGDYLGYASEFDSAAALIKEQLVNQYIGDDGRIDLTALGVTADELYDKETGGLSTKAISLLSEQAKSQAKEYQSYYDAIESLGQADEFEEFVSQAKLGKFSTSYAKEQLKEFVDGDEQSEFYTDYWASIEDSIKEQREQFVNFIEDKDSRTIEIPEELTNMSEELPAFLLTNIRSTIKRIESQIKDNKITESQGEAFVESYNRFIQAIYSENSPFTKAQQDEIANLLSEADLSSVTGIYDFVETLKNAGFQEIVDSLEIDTLVKNNATNLVTEFENLQSTIISNLDSLAEALSSASEGMELSEALTMAEKLGVSVSDFKFKNGKFFYEDYNKIVETYLKDYTELEEQLFGEDSVLSKMKDAAGHDLFTQFTSAEQIDNIKLLLNGFVNSSDELERQSAVDALAVLNQYGTQYLDWVKLTENEGKNFSDFMSVYVQEEINAFNAQKEKWQTWLLENSLTEQEIARTEAQNLLSKTTGFTYEELSTLSTELGINTVDFFTKQADGTYNTTFDNIVTILNGTRQDIVTELMYSIESDMKNLKDSAGSLGEKIGSEHGGFGLEVSDIWELYGEQLGDNFDEAYTALYDYLQAGDMGEEFAEAIEYYTGGKVSKNDALKQYEEYVRGLTRGTEEYTKTFFEYKMKLLTGEMKASEVESMSDSDLRTDLKDFIGSVDEWAALTLEQRMAKISSLLMEDDTLTESERRSELEKQWESQLKETEAYQNIDESRRKKEIENIIRETGGKDLTEAQLAQIRAVYEASIEAIATDSGWTITGKVPSSFVDEQKRFYSDVANSAAEGAKDLLSSMAEGTLTGAAIQDYFEEHNIEIDYAKAEELANGTMDALLETIVSSLSAQGIDISDKMEEIMAAIMDAILESISSGISSLGSGLEGTLSAADYQSLAKKYGLTGVGTSKTSKGIRLGTADQQKLISQMFLEAQSAGLESDFGEQIWEVYRDNQEDAIDGYTAIEEEIARVKSEHEELTGEALAYVEALQQARHAAMFDEDSVEFAFMEQDATDGLTKNFDKFVDSIEKVKDVFSAFKSKEAIGYQDFYNMMDFIGNSEAGFAKFSKMTGIAAADYEAFVNSVVANTDEWGKVDIGGVAAKMGISVDAAMSAMSESMTEGLKEVAKQQIKYLTGLEQMLMALAALEALGDIDLDMGFSIDFEDGAGPIDVALTNIYDIWKRIEGLEDQDLKLKLSSEFDAGVKDYLAGPTGDILDSFVTNMFKGAEGFSFYELFFGSDGQDGLQAQEAKLLQDLGTFISNMPEDLSFDDSQWIGIAEQLMAALNLNGDEFSTPFSEWSADMKTKFMQAFSDVFGKGFDFSTILSSVNDEIATALAGKLGENSTITLPSGTEITVQGFTFKLPEGTTTEQFGKMKEEIEAQIKALTGQDVEASFQEETGLITFTRKADMTQLNTDFQTAAEAASTLQTAITQISAVASTFQAGSGFQSLADQLNAAASAAKELISALTGQEIESPDISALQAELAAAQAYLDSLNPFSTDAEGNAIQVDYAQLDAAEEKVKSLQTQLKSLQGPPTGVASGIIGELEKATNIANKLSEALSNNNGTPLEVNFNADDANGQVTVLITNLLELNKTFEPTITVDDVEAQATIADVLMQLENVHIQNPTPIVDITDKASAVLESIIGLINSINSKTVTITTIHKDIYMTSFSRGGGGGDNQSYSMRWTGTANDITGPARAGGTVGNLQKGAQLANKTLVGELGPELAVYDGKYHLLGESGAEFVKLPKSAIVFNHLQTAGILSGQMKNARGEPLTPGGALATGNVTGPAAASGIAGALAAVRRAKSVWQGLLNSLSAADLMGSGGGGGGGGGDDNSLKAHIADLQEWYNLSRQIADIEGQINILLAKRKSITDGHEYLRNLRETQRLLDDQVNTQQDLLRFQELQLQRQAEHINNNKIWSQFLQVDENGLLQYKKGNETNGGKGALEVLQQMNEMSGSEQLAFVQSLGWSYTNTDGEELEDEELVAKFFEELQKQIDDYDALRDTVVEAEEALADLEEEINEIEREIRDNEIDLSKEIYDIIVDAWKENIENLKEQNDLIKEANEAYANGIQEAIDAERRMYEQNTAISDREQLQRQLALMRRSGGSASEIADLEQQLDDMLKEEYFSNQEKQLETIQKANERQAELLNQQVKIQEEMLEYQQENGVIWQKVYEVMSGTDAEIIDFMLGNSTNFFEQSALQQEDMLTEWAKKIGIYTEERQRQNYTAEAEKTFDSVWDTETGEKLQEAYNQADSKDQQTWKREYNDTYASKRLEGMTYEEASKYAQNEFYEHIQNWLKAQEDEQNQQDSGSNNNNNSNNSTKGRYETVTYWQAYGRVGNSQGDKKVTGPRTTNGESAARQALKANNPAAFNIQVSKWTVQEWRKYAKGGIIDFTGPAWVDGSKSKPERILSAEQNKILEEGLAMNAGRSDKLKDMFSDFATILGSSIRESITNIATNTSSQAITIQPGAIQLNISQLNDSYDVDELFNDVADRLYSIAARASSRGVRRR